MVYPWAGPSWWTETPLDLHYGYQVSGVLYTYEKVYDPTDAPQVSETSFFIDSYVDGYNNRVRTNLYEDSLRQKPI
jgi:hypothetical protein